MCNEKEEVIFNGEQNGVKFDILRIDNSLLHQDGSMGIEVIYELFELDNSKLSYMQVSDLIREKYQDFYFSKTTPELLAEYFNLSGQPFTCSCYVDGSTFYKNLLSINMRSEWYMGGVYNTDFNGMVFDIETGKACELAELCGMSADETLSNMKKAILDHMEIGEYMYADWARDKVETLELSDLNFSVDGGGTVFLFFPTYEMGDGAAGPLVLNTGIRIA